MGANPVNGIDPNGLLCISVNGRTNCSMPGGPSIRIPSPDGFPKSISSKDLLYHSYNVQRSLGGADAKCVLQKLINNPTPGLSNPATAIGTQNNARVLGIDNRVTSYLTSDTQTGQPVIVNVTSKGSALADGYVARTIANGAVQTVGEGTNWRQSPLLTGFDTQFMLNEVVWGGQMQTFIDECKCK